MHTNRNSPAIEMLVELTRQEPFGTITLFVFGFLTTAISRAVLVAFVATEILTRFLYLGVVGTAAVSWAFSLYFVVGYLVWYKHEGFYA